MATTAQSNKIVENYTLDAIKYVNADQSEVWVAKHKVLKKFYMLKKCKLVKGTGRDNEKVGCENDANVAGMQKITRQVELLKILKIEGAPKCQKMIKTASSIFLVYDEFAGISLAELAKTQLKSFESKLETMLQVARKLLSFHNQEVVFLQLSPQNIFLKNNQHVFFSQWSLCIFKSNSKGIFPVNNAKKSQFIAHQVTEESRFSTASDIYSLGKIFSYITLCNNSGKENEVPRQISEVIEKMSEKKVKNRPTLQDVIQALERSRDTIRLESRRERPEKELALTENSSSPTYETQHEQGRSNLFSIQTPSIQERSEPSLMKGEKGIRPPRTISFDNILTGMRRAGSQTSISPTKKNAEAISRRINKTRNLSYFILNLSEFAMKWPNGEFLSFILLKQSYQILNSCYLQLKSQGLKDTKSLTILQVLKKETVHMNLSVNLMKEYFLSQDTQPQFKAELRNDLSISERYYREQIMSFSNEFMKYINTIIRQNKVSSLNNLVNDLFSLYMILKRVEEGSFEKYWDKIYSPDYAFLRNQKYFIEEKKLGYRYLKSKIAEVLSKK